MEAQTQIQRPDFKEALQFWFKLGWISFGGTAGHIAIMHDSLVDHKKWISNSKFLHALNHCMILPGPEAQQLAIYIGWLLHGKKGGLAAGILFVLPSMFILLGLSIIYVLFGSIPWVTALFAGLKPAVIALIFIAMVRIGQKALHGPLHYAVAAMAFICIFFFKTSLLAIIGGTVILGMLVRLVYPNALPGKQQRNIAEEEEHTYVLHRNTVAPGGGFRMARLFRLLGIAFLLWLVPFALFFLFFRDFSFWKNLGLFFTQTAFVTVGGSYTVLPYVAQFSVTKLNWLTKLQMIDGFALAETTPGPLIIVLSFVGFMAGYNHFNGSLWMGTAGLVATTYFTFLPCFLMIFAGAPIIEKTHGIHIIENILGLITAAVVGVILHLTLYLGKDVLFPGDAPFTQPDILALVWIIISLVLILRFKMNMLYVIGLSVLYGWVHYLCR
ncbi:chromate efflux transporter [Chitinophaga arvensicola]|uniref:Chromate transporter n=1 Tax=Chitinophaga arvensicola TaxID=29529 RepID=A0A1I0QB25_9BACT|nr:chromate efflux transporter [Chitinophaga arvensicola]SEW24241.1 chromate transporter [Chitinophaga arvensicola]